MRTSLLQNLPLPGAELDPAALPKRVDRRMGAEIISRLYFQISPRTLETWPLTYTHVNGRAMALTSELLALAQQKLDAAPSVRGGRRKVPSNIAA
ncbi:MAG: hypothetical protein JO110_07825 [Acetobacteraceae bacterium]|nr:hypothetical protein [Acetobacteraceae bacterium]